MSYSKETNRALRAAWGFGQDPVIVAVILGMQPRAVEEVFARFDRKRAALQESARPPAAISAAELSP